MNLLFNHANQHWLNEHCYGYTLKIVARVGPRTLSSRLFDATQ